MPEQQIDQYGKPDILRTAIMRIMSEMLDDEGAQRNGLYQTSRFMDRIERLLESLMVAPEVMQLSGSEALFGFAAWLTTADKFQNALTNPCYGPTQDAAPWADFVGEFIATNKLTEPRAMWAELLTHPVDKVA